MRKLLAAAAMSTLAMTYFVAPDAVTAGFNGTANLFVAAGRAALSVVTLGAGGGTAPASGGGHVETLPDGTQVWIPDGATVQPVDGGQ